MKKEHIKSFILILLLVNSIQLTAQLWLDSSWNGLSKGTSWSVSSLFSFWGGGNGDLNESKMYADATRPRRIIVNGGGAREVYIVDSESYEAALQMSQGVMATMKDSSVNVQNISYEQWQNLFKGKSLYLDFGFDVNAATLNSMYGLQTEQSNFDSFKRASGIIITPDAVTNTCSVAVWDEEDDSVYEHKFSCDAMSVLEFIENSTIGKQQNDTFAFEINLDTSSTSDGEVERMVGLTPLSLLSISADMLEEKQIETRGLFEDISDLEKFAEKALPAFGYNPSTLRKTVQNNGTVEFVENNATIKFGYDGTVEYSAVSKDRGMKISDSVPSANQAVNDVLKVVRQLWQESGMEQASMNLHLASELIDNKENNYVVSFDNMHNGIVLNYPSGSNHAVYARVEDGYITEFVIHLVDIAESEETVETIPVLSAIDILYAIHGTNKMIIDDVYKCYDLGEDESISVKWAFEVRGTKEILVIDDTADE